MSAVTHENRPTRVAGIVVAAGRGQRLTARRPKQFLEIAGRSLTRHAVDALTGGGLDAVVVVVPPHYLDGPEAARLRRTPGVSALVAGGATRAESVERGLAKIEDAEYVLVHDAARPFAPQAVVRAVLEATLRHGAAVPCLPLTDTIKRVDRTGTIQGTVDRESLRRAQTPQGSRTDWLRSALQSAAARGVEVTDEAAALELAGRPVRAVAGHADNLKITTETDLRRARGRAGPAEPTLRIGSGFDIHRFVDGRTLKLGGVEFPGERGLAGHSDADVVLHAVMDALLGATGRDDIGVRFPPDDDRFRGADSAQLTREVARELDRSGWAVVNLDVTLLAERPRLGARRDAMRAAIARCLGIGAAQVGLKATTLEGLGALGRQEGIACQAVALVRRHA